MKVKVKLDGMDKLETALTLAKKAMGDLEKAVFEVNSSLRQLGLSVEQTEEESDS